MRSLVLNIPLLPENGSPPTAMTPYLQIALATRADAGEIAELSRTLIEHGLPWRWTPERVARTIAKPNVNAVVVRDKGGLSGFGIMEYLEDDAHLLLFAVQPGLPVPGASVSRPGTTILRPAISTMIMAIMRPLSTSGCTWDCWMACCWKSGWLRRASKQTVKAMVLPRPLRRL
jgi:hypothetical protein